MIRWDREEQAVHVWSADPVVWRKLAKLGVAVKEETYAQRTGEVTGRFYQPIPLGVFRFGVKRPRTAAQRIAAREVGMRLAGAKKVLGADTLRAVS